MTSHRLSSLLKSYQCLNFSGIEMDIQNQRPYKDSELIFPPIELWLRDEITIKPGVKKNGDT